MSQECQSQAPPAHFETERLTPNRYLPWNPAYVTLWSGRLICIRVSHKLRGNDPGPPSQGHVRSPMSSAFPAMCREVSRGHPHVSVRIPSGHPHLCPSSCDLCVLQMVLGRAPQGYQRCFLTRATHPLDAEHQLFTPSVATQLSRLLECSS